MTKVFLVQDTGVRIVQYNWFCDKCDCVTVRKEIRRGEFSAEDYWPSNTPSSERCPDCGNWASFLSASLITIWTRVDNGEEIKNLKNHPGACYVDKAGAWDSTHKVKRFGPDGRALVIVLPDGFRWYLDSRASNCDRKDDQTHRCWIQHGSPEDGNLTIDKNGDTCNAGSGSIVSNGWHGFLTQGTLTEC